jgi:hypothetical protein
VGGERVGERAQRAGTVGGRERAPLRERGASGRDSLVELGWARARDLGEYRLGGGLED